jgi:hypothetical protein
MCRVFWTYVAGMLRNLLFKTIIGVVVFGAAGALLQGLL